MPKIELKKTNAQNNYDMSQILAELQKLNTNFAILKVGRQSMIETGAAVV